MIIDAWEVSRLTAQAQDVELLMAWMRSWLYVIVAAPLLFMLGGGE